MTDDPDLLGSAERAYLEARDADDRREVARRAGRPEPPDEPLLAAVDAVRAALDRLDRDALTPADRRAVEAMERGLATMTGDGADADRTPSDLEIAFAETAEALAVGDERVSRLALLGRLGVEPDPRRRRELFLALSPLWQVVDGDGGASSPYRALLADSAARWAAGESPVDENARALGIDTAELAGWCEAILEAWRSLVGDDPPIEPWDWWWANGELSRRIDALLPPERLRPVSDAYHRALGADVDALGIVLDTPRPQRPPVMLAETVFGGRPRRRADGSWSTGAPTVFATYSRGGLGELVELVHETGHAIHLAAIRTRPAFADWPDSDALSEAIAEIPTMDVWREEWLRRWVGAELGPIPPRLAGRAAFADAAMDAAWALFEIRLHADPSLRPNDVWTDLAAAHLGVTRHPEWSWWAIRGQLIEAPGYMANYPIGAILAADLRAAIRAARGDWIEGDPGWYTWVSDHLLRFGLERSSGEVIRELLGRPPSPDALLAEIRAD